jgi:hypothetical protein
MTQTLASLVRVGAALVACLALWATPSPAQDMSADVRTWSGQSWRLAQPSLEVFYTIPAPPKGGPDYGAPPPSGGGKSSLSMSGPLQALESFFDSGPGPRQGHRQADYITIRRGEVETRLPVASVTSLTFTRRPVSGSPLPPYFASRHVRYGATATLTDGSRVEGDYVNFGTLVLRGQTAEGRVDISWEDIESVRFQR